MGILASLRTYRGKWNVSGKESFNDSELSTLEIESNVVVASDFGKSVCLTLKNGGYNYIPVSTEGRQPAIGETLDLSQTDVVTLSRQGDDDIYRIEVK